MSKLTVLAISKLKEKGSYPDGGNLYLQVSKSGSKSWLFRYMLNGKSREMGLGRFPDISTAEARDKANTYRKLVAEGIDPITTRKAEQDKLKLAAAKATTFEECAKAYIAAHEAAWKNEKHIWQWSNSLGKFVYPVFGSKAVDEIDITLVMQALEPIWKTKTETAKRVRSRIESILNWATVRGYRTGDNPALWKGRLQELLPSPTKIQKVQHHPALHHRDIAIFMKELRSHDNASAKALELVILTATRTSEVLNAEWDEFDLSEKKWVIPAGRIKMGKAHSVPLSPRALAIIKEMEAVKQNKFVFAGAKKGEAKPLSNMVMLTLLRRMKRSDITVHGFRSTFRDWVAEMTETPHEIAEAALAHTVGNRVVEAYKRSDLYDKRKPLMEAWADYCGGKSAIKNPPKKRSKVSK